LNGAIVQSVMEKSAREAWPRPSGPLAFTSKKFALRQLPGPNVANGWSGPMVPLLHVVYVGPKRKATA
jgi:hypothetical protein